MADRFEGILRVRRALSPEIVVAVIVVIMVGMMVIPIPAFLLDIMQSVSITLGLVVILVAMYVSRPIDFSIFPSLLLFATLFRLALNVSSTRLILLQGINFQGKVIRAFGEFVVGGNYIVGLVVFLILLVIQFLVITRGTNRISEVAARFTLDAMPIEQMQTMTLLQQGLITEDEARRRMDEVRRRADFYGAMDGASRFIQGDVIASLVITLINIIGGLLIGTLQRGEPLAEAAKTYVLLTVGDGLVNQIPALLISTSAGLVVTRSSTDREFARDIIRQLTIYPRALFITAALLAFFGIFTPLPTVPLLILAGFLLAVGIAVSFGWFSHPEETPEEKVSERESEQETPEADIRDLIRVDPIRVEMGYYAVSLLTDPAKRDKIVQGLRDMRKRIAEETGFIPPKIRIVSSDKVGSNEYVVYFYNGEVDKGILYPNKLLAIPTSQVEGEIAGVPAVEPVDKKPAYWIEPSSEAMAKKMGYEVKPPEAVLYAHLYSLLTRKAYKLMTVEEVQKILDVLKEEDQYPTLVDNVLSVVEGDKKVIQKVLARLLREKVPIRRIVDILEVIADKYSQIRDIDLLVAYIRVAIGDEIARQVVSPDGKTIRAIKVGANLERLIGESLTFVKDQATGAVIDSSLNLSPEIQNRIVHKLRALLEEFPFSPRVVVSDFYTRIALSALIESAYPEIEKRFSDLYMVAYQEVMDYDIEIVDELELTQEEVSMS